MPVKTRGAILLILVTLVLAAGCLEGSSDTGSKQPPLPTYTTSPPATTPPPTTAGPLTDEQTKIRQDLVGRQLSTVPGDVAYTVKPDDIKAFNRETLDEMPVWKVTVEASNATYPYRWFVYYTTDGVLHRTHKLF